MVPANFTPTVLQRTIAPQIGKYVIVGKEKFHMRPNGHWSGPEEATQCEMKMWRLLEKYVGKTVTAPVPPVSPTQGSEGTGTRPTDSPTPPRVNADNLTFERLSSGSTLNQLNLTLRVKERLWNANIRELSDLLAQTPRQLQRLSHFGDKGVVEIEKALEALGLRLSDSICHTCGQSKRPWGMRLSD